MTTGRHVAGDAQASAVSQAQGGDSGQDATRSRLPPLSHATWIALGFLCVSALAAPGVCVALGRLHFLAAFFGAAAWGALIYAVLDKLDRTNAYTIGATIIIWISSFFTYAVTNDFAGGGAVARGASILEAPASHAHGFIFRDATIDLDRAYEWKEERRATGTAAPEDSEALSIWFTIAPFVREGASEDEPVSAWAMCVDELDACAPRMRHSPESGRTINEVYRKSVERALKDLEAEEGVKTTPGAVILEVDPDPKSARYYYAVNYVVTSLMEFVLLGIVALLAQLRRRRPPDKDELLTKSVGDDQPKIEPAAA